jgi:hypothetical protein
LRLKVGGLRWRIWDAGARFKVEKLRVQGSRFRV